MSTPTYGPGTARSAGAGLGVDEALLDLHLTGMTCASCANRIEKKLNKVPGVVATVNYATETATVRAPAGVSLDELVTVVEDTGYGVRLPDTEAVDDPDELGRRWRISAILSVPVVLTAMVMPLQFVGWQWMSLMLTTIVVTWGAAPFHRSAWVNARHGTTSMDTLVSIGVLASYLWSTVAVLFTSAGALGMTMEMSWLPKADEAGAHPDLYFESAAVVTTFLLLGRWLEQRAKSRSGAALRALLDLAPTTAWVRTPSGDTEIPAAHVTVGDIVVVKPGERIATDGLVVEGESAIDASMLTGESVPVEVGPGDEVAGGTVVQDGLLVLRATRVGADTALARITALVTAAQSGKAPVQRLADRVVCGLRAGRPRGRRPHPAGVGAHDRVAAGLHRGRRRPRDRLPLRPRPRHADRAARRHRPGRRHGRARARARGARVHPTRRHRGAGQDRHASRPAS